MENLLEIILITYNRAALLEQTLLQLINSPISKFKITILDNCSTDITNIIFEKYKPKFANFNYVKNKINIGPDANYLRAVELSNGIYTWVLCDDDIYDFTDFEDVYNQLEKQIYSCVYVGFIKNFPWIKNGEALTARQAFEDFNIPILNFGSFMPGFIFKTIEMNTQIIKGYKNIVNMFPHIPFHIFNVENNKLIYIAKSQIVMSGAFQRNYSQKQLLIGWIKTSLLFQNKKDQKKCFFNTYSNTHSKLKTTFLNAQLFKFFKMNTTQIIEFMSLIQIPYSILFFIFYLFSFITIHLPFPIMDANGIKKWIPLKTYFKNNY